LKESESGKKSDKDIYELLKKSYARRNGDKRKHLLKELDVQDFFGEGDITIDKKTCKGIECKLCIDACPTHALFWKAGEVGIDEDLCVYCAACVLCCIVDDCIRVWRRRSNGEKEEFSKPKDVLLLLNNIDSIKRRDKIKDLLESKREAKKIDRKNRLTFLLKHRKRKMNF